MEKQIKIGSSNKNLKEIDEFLGSIFRDFNITNNQYFKIYLSLNEAVVNAIQHGNKYDESKFVIITFTAKAQFFEFVIEDEGNGFDENAILNPTDRENIKCESGRGIFIMKNYSDSFEILNKGSRIKLNFLRKSD